MVALRPDREWWPSWRTDPVLEAFEAEDRADSEATERDRLMYPVMENGRKGWQKERET